MELEQVYSEYFYHCKLKNYTAKTMKNKAQELKQLKQWLNEKRGISELETIHQSDIKAYVRYKQKRNLKPVSIKSMMNQVRAFFNWCVDEGYIEVAPTDGVQTPKVNKELMEGFTTREVLNMISAYRGSGFLNVRNRAILSLMADTGLRVMEVINLKNSNFKDDYIQLIGKGGKERIVYISPALYKILNQYDKSKQRYFKHRIMYDQNYFLTYQGRKLSNTSMWNLVTEAGRRANVTGKRVSPHMFRHYFAVQSLLSGIDLFSLSRLLGHSSISVTQRYLETITDVEIKDKAVKSSPLMNIYKNDRER